MIKYHKKIYKLLKWKIIFQNCKECLKQNKLLVEKKLVIQNFGNVSLRLDNDHLL